MLTISPHGEEMPFSHLKSRAGYALLDMREQISMLFQDSKYIKVNTVALLWNSALLRYSFKSITIIFIKTTMMD